jgi:CheY-like chemotaxis protein
MTAVPESLVVLLADDDTNDLLLIRRAFKRLASLARLIEVRDGDEVAAYLEGKGQYADRAAWPMPRLVVLDQWMPRLSGFEVLCWIRSDPRFAFLPVLMLTGGVPPSQAELMERFKAAYCIKVSESKKMLDTLRASVAMALQLVWANSSNPRATWFTPAPATGVTLKHRPEVAQVRA